MRLFILVVCAALSVAQVRPVFFSPSLSRDREQVQSDVASTTIPLEDVAAQVVPRSPVVEVVLTAQTTPAPPVETFAKPVAVPVFGLARPATLEEVENVLVSVPFDTAELERAEQFSANMTREFHNCVGVPTDITLVFSFWQEYNCLVDRGDKWFDNLSRYMQMPQPLARLRGRADVSELGDPMMFYAKRAVAAREQVALFMLFNACTGETHLLEPCKGAMTALRERTTLTDTGVVPPHGAFDLVLFSRCPLGDVQVCSMMLRANAELLKPSDPDFGEHAEQLVRQHFSGPLTAGQIPLAVLQARLRAAENDLASCPSLQRFCQRDKTQAFLEALMDVQMVLPLADAQAEQQRYFDAVRECRTRCIVARPALASYSDFTFRLLAQERAALQFIALYVCKGGASCTTSMQAVLARNKRAAIFAASQNGAVLSSVDSLVTVGGVAMASTTLVLTVAVIVLGLVWRTLFASMIWPVMLGGLLAASAARIVSWLSAGAVVAWENNFDAKLSTAFLQLFAVSLALGWFFLGIILVFLYRWMDLMHTVVFPAESFPKNRLAVGFAVLLGLLGAGLVVTVILTNTLYRDELIAARGDLFDFTIAFVPLVVLEAFGIIFSGILLGYAILGRREMSRRREELKVSALHLRLLTMSVAVNGLICAIFCQQLLATVIHWKPFGFYFPSGYLAAAMVVPEGVLTTAVLIFVVLTWWPARTLRLVKSQPLLQEDELRSSAVPSRYADI
jgi:hypothetical protein